MVRSYKDTDYYKLKELYGHSEWYGGQFDEARDGREKLKSKIAQDNDSILVYEKNGELLGSISLIEDGRVAWLFRFVVKDNDQQIAQELYDHATHVLKARGCTQVLVYSPNNEDILSQRYKNLGM